MHFAANLKLGCANIGSNDSSEASTVGNAVNSAVYFVWRLDDFAAFSSDYKPNLSTVKSRTSICIGGGAATTCEVTEEAASRKVNMSSSCPKAARVLVC